MFYINRITDNSARTVMQLHSWYEAMSVAKARNEWSGVFYYVSEERL